ncbi:MAG: hypothetical protein KatS3mg105_4366 [Gemmatales bacterium]|nr:MAG: hypothetical protein KatS3mg105_4366 [Gemmatales bacterium]
MSRQDRCFWRVAGLFAVVTALGMVLPVYCGDQPKRPNILWIVAENISLDLECYGASHVKTPNLNRLATEGTRFTRVFATSPVCAPSRSAFMTGMYQTTTDTHHMRSHRNDDFRLPPGVRPLTHWLQEAGYATFNIKTIGSSLVGTGKLDLNFVNEGKIFQSDRWAELKKKQPFFAMINTPEVEYDIYDRKSAAKVRVPWVGEAEHPKVARPEEIKLPPYYPDHPVARAEWARYLNSVSGLDVRVGKILKALKRDGLEDDTIVVFFADNGRLEVRGIHFCYDSGLHVPLLIRWPKNFPPPADCRPGSVNDRLVSLLDLTATTLDMAGIKRPPLMQSRIFVGPNSDPPRKFAFSARDRIDETVNRIRSVRDARFRYNRNFKPEQSLAALNRYREKCFLVMPLARQLHAAGELTGPAQLLVAPRLPEEELYDAVADPFHIHNLVHSQKSEHREALVRLRAALDVWIIDTGDRGHIPEPKEVVDQFEAEMHKWFGTPSWYKKPIRNK